MRPTIWDQQSSPRKGVRRAEAAGWIKARGRILRPVKGTLAPPRRIVALRINLLNISYRWSIEESRFVNYLVALRSVDPHNSVAQINGYTCPLRLNPHWNPRETARTECISQKWLASVEGMIAHWCFVSLLCHGFIQTSGLFRTRGLFPPRSDPNLLIVSEMI